MSEDSFASLLFLMFVMPAVSTIAMKVMTYLVDSEIFIGDVNNNRDTFREELTNTNSTISFIDIVKSLRYLQKITNTALVFLQSLLTDISSKQIASFSRFWSNISTSIGENLRTVSNQELNGAGDAGNDPPVTDHHRPQADRDYSPETYVRRLRSGTILYSEKRIDLPLPGVTHTESSPGFSRVSETSTGRCNTSSAKRKSCRLRDWYGDSIRQKRSMEIQHDNILRFGRPKSLLQNPATTPKLTPINTRSLPVMGSNTSAPSNSLRLGPRSSQTAVSTRKNSSQEISCQNSRPCSPPMNPKFRPTSALLAAVLNRHKAANETKRTLSPTSSDDERADVHFMTMFS